MATQPTHTWARTALACSLITLVSHTLAPSAAAGQIPESVVRSYLWPADSAAFAAAAERVASDPALVGVTLAQMHDLEELMRAGPPVGGAAGATPRGAAREFTVATPGDRRVPVFVRAPSDYRPDRQWPLMFAMHGGPPGSAEGAIQGARRMIDVWADAADAAGWIVAAPAMVDVVARDGRTAERLPYEIFQPEEARAVIDAVRARFAVNPDRIVSTGISLGSNFSIAYAAAHPDWFSAIVPVSTEGESREPLLRNLAPVPTYVLEGSQDRNIRGVGGPRALSEIMTSLGADIVYREFSDRAHEGFGEHYGDVLRWLDSRPRDVAPRRVLRVPHAGIVPVARRIHWVEADTRQGVVLARVVGPHEIDVSVRWATEVELFLNDALVDLERAVTVRVNGVETVVGPLQRSMRVALEEARRLGDERSVYAARVELEVPAGGEAVARSASFTEGLTATHPGGTLSFWEMYAVRALEERFPSVGFTGVEVPLPAGAPAAPERAAVRVDRVDRGGPAARAGLAEGDVLLSFGGEPFFQGRGAVRGLYRWLVRELRTTPRVYELVVWRGGRAVTLRATYALGEYRPGG